MTPQLTAPVVSVTVYPDQARVVRRGRITLPTAGAITDILLADLPLGLVHESVRVTGRGAGAIAGIDVRTVRHASDDSERIAALLAEKQRLTVSAQEVVDERRALDLRITMLESVAEEAGKPYARKLATGLSPEDVGPVGERIAAQLADVLAQRRILLATDQRIADERARVDRELESTAPAPDRTEIAIAVESGAGEMELEVSYLVDGATWEPRYDIRLSEDESDGDGSGVEVTWLGMVRQWSGEDWPEVELRLSTARPTAEITIPDLDPWFLTERPTLRQPRGAASAMPVAAPPMAMAVPAGMSFDAMESAEPMTPTAATLETGVTAATYVVQHPVAVPSDASEHQALISRFRLPADVDYVTAPVRSDDVFLRATVTNTSPHTLRAGRAALFHGSEFVGVSDLTVLAPHEEVELALGLDDRIRVKRELVARHADKAFLGGAARHEARWRTTLANHTGKPAAITVIDQAPVSRVPGITVREVKATPEAKIDDLGEVTWRVELADAQQISLDLTVRVEVSKGVSMAGWRE